MNKMRHPIHMVSYICSHNTQCTCPDIQFKLELTVNGRFNIIVDIRIVTCPTLLIVLQTGNGWDCIYIYKLL